MTARGRWPSHRQYGNDGNGRTTQLGYIIGPKRTSDKAYIHNDDKIWDTWDHYPIYASTHEDDARNYFPRRKKKCAGWRPSDDVAKSEFKKITMKKLRKKVAHTTKFDRDKEVMRTPGEVRMREEAAARCTKLINKRVLRKQARKAEADHLMKCSMMPGKNRMKRKPLDGVVCQWQIHGRQRRMASRTSTTL